MVASAREPVYVDPSASPNERPDSFEISATHQTNGLSTLKGRDVRRLAATARVCGCLRTTRSRLDLTAALRERDLTLLTPPQTVVEVSASVCTAAEAVATIDPPIIDQ